jgi:class I fructose-bisphosphate aldolase
MTFVNEHPGMSGIVLNVGALDRVPSDFRKSLVPQLMSSPPLVDGSLVKVQVGTVEDAVRAGASVVSLQLNFEDQSVSRQVEVFSAIRSAASRLGIPVLTMINLKDRSSFNFNKFADYLAYVAELGCDLIKVNLPADAEGHVTDIQAILRYLPPVLLSGDPLSDDYLHSVRLSKECGFGGLCVGRNIFQSPDPSAIVDASCAIYKTES